jgi:nitroreductase
MHSDFIFSNDGDTMIDLLRKRRSIRKYSKKPIPASVQRRLVEALLRSPSSRDIRPWRFVFIDDPALLEKLSLSKASGAGFFARAPLGIVICGDEKASDVWIEDCSIASIMVQMAALELGLGSCWIQIRNRSTSDGTPSEAYVRDALSLPNNFRVLSMIALGYPAEKKRPISRRKLSFNKVFRNRFEE